MELPRLGIEREGTESDSHGFQEVSHGWEIFGFSLEPPVRELGHISQNLAVSPEP
jgi:hypothetical protein